MVDILLSYSYHCRTTSENNVESAWTISKLSSSLCWLEEFQKIEHCIISFIRRVLCFPFRRRYELAIECIKDCTKLLIRGKSFVLKCLIDIKDIFDHDQEKYLLNKLFIDDYCVWIQKENDSSLVKLAEKIDFVLKNISKKDVGFNIEGLEILFEECKKEGVFEMDEQDFEKPREGL